MTRSLELVLAVLQFLGGLLTELVERRFLGMVFHGVRLFRKGMFSSLEFLHQLPWWAKVIISLLGLGGLAWICF